MTKLLVVKRDCDISAFGKIYSLTIIDREYIQIEVDM